MFCYLNYYSPFKLFESILIFLQEKNLLILKQIHIGLLFEGIADEFIIYLEMEIC